MRDLAAVDGERDAEPTEARRLDPARKPCVSGSLAYGAVIAAVRPIREPSRKIVMPPIRRRSVPKPDVSPKPPSLPGTGAALVARANRRARDNGEIGDGKPTTLRALRAIGPTRVPGLEGITQIAVDASHNLALKADGRVMAWGDNSDGQLGNGTRGTGWTPAEVVGLDRVAWIAAGTASGKGSSGAVRDDGTVWMWGTGISGQMGAGGRGALSPDDPGGRNPLPVVVKGVAGAKWLGIGNGHVAALLADGTLRMWGHDGWGQIGVGTAGGYQNTPMRVSGITNVVTMYIGGYHSMAVRADGTLWIWGRSFIEGGAGLLGTNLRVPTRFDLD